MNISIPFAHPSAPPDAGAEQARVRGRYVSVEYVREVDGGDKVEWWMATASDAGGKSEPAWRGVELMSRAGSIPQFLTNMSLPGKVTEVSRIDSRYIIVLIHICAGCTVVRPLLERPDQEQCGRWYRSIGKGDNIVIVEDEAASAHSRCMTDYEPPRG